MKRTIGICLFAAVMLLVGGLCGKTAFDAGRIRTAEETEAVTEAEMRSRIEAVSSAFPYFVYEYDGAVIGYCYAHPWKDRAAYAKTLETTVYLAPEACGQGIGGGSDAAAH